jgi:hypothetical protein
MSKLILMSILIAIMAIPTIASRDPDPRRGLKRTITRILVFEVFYALALIFLWGRW